MWKVVDVHWTDYVNKLVMECGNCGKRFEWWSRITVCNCPHCGARGCWHDFNGSEDQPYPIAVVDLEEKT